MQRRWGDGGRVRTEPRREEREKGSWKEGARRRNEASLWERVLQEEEVNTRK